MFVMSYKHSRRKDSFVYIIELELKRIAVVSPDQQAIKIARDHALLLARYRTRIKNVLWNFVSLFPQCCLFLKREKR